MIPCPWFSQSKIPESRMMNVEIYCYSNYHAQMTGDIVTELKFRVRLLPKCFEGIKLQLAEVDM
jgi:hypothetical protein